MVKGEFKRMGKGERDHFVVVCYHIMIHSSRPQLLCGWRWWGGGVCCNILCVIGRVIPLLYTSGKKSRVH